jgi:predicted Fe-Mo cluster-binding NifX family protein
VRWCIPTLDDLGLEARLSPHFGRSPYYTLVEAATGVTEVVVNGGAGGGECGCGGVEWLQGRGVGGVVCAGLGRRALERLEAAGMVVLVAEAGRVSDAVREAESGRLARLSRVTACHGHGHGHGH